jgi:hypothetical protein
LFSDRICLYFKRSRQPRVGLTRLEEPGLKLYLIEVDEVDVRVQSWSKKIGVGYWLREPFRRAMQHTEYMQAHVLNKNPAMHMPPRQAHPAVLVQYTHTPTRSRSSIIHRPSTCLYIFIHRAENVICLLPHPLQLLQHHQIRIQEPIHALPHARLLVFIQCALLYRAAGDAFPEACIGEAVDSYHTPLANILRKGGQRCDEMRMKPVQKY